jgi:hypothetical protein
MKINMFLICHPKSEQMNISLIDRAWQRVQYLVNGVIRGRLTWSRDGLCGLTITAVNASYFSKLSDTFVDQMPIGDRESIDVCDERTTSLCEPLIQSRRTAEK